jgi:hypothetical protein
LLKDGRCFPELENSVFRSDEREALVAGSG